MSQHQFPAITSSGRAVEILIGYDRPLQGFFLVVTDREKAVAIAKLATQGADDDEDYPDDGDVYVYSNLADVELIDLGGMTLDLAYFKNKLALLGIALPVNIEHELQDDRSQRIGNRFCQYDSAGQPLPGAEG